VVGYSLFTLGCAAVPLVRGEGGKKGRGEEGEGGGKPGGGG